MQTLSSLEQQSRTSVCFTVITGRRQIGKTELVRQFLLNRKGCYLFTSRSSEPMLTTLWQQQLKEQIGLNIFGTVPTLTQLFEQVMIFSEFEHFSLVIDEFQDLESVNRSFFNSMQNIWDTYQNKSKIDIIVLNDIEKNAHIYEVKR